MPILKIPLEPREYQTNIYNEILKKGSTLVVLPTGLGKTIIAIMLFAHLLEKKANAKILFLAPTKPLVDQHLASIQKYLYTDSITITGTIPPKKRNKLIEDNQIIIATPQTIANDLPTLNVNFDLIIFDEAHKAQGLYAYTLIAKRYTKSLKVGLTASPGTKRSEVKQVMSNLGLDNLEVRTSEDLDVSPYTHDIKTYWIKVSLPEQLQEINKLLTEFIEEKANQLRSIGYALRHGFTQMELLNIQKRIFIELEQKNPLAFRGISLIASMLKINHAITLLETQGINALKTYFEKLTKENDDKKSKAAKTIFNDEKVKKCKLILDGLNLMDIEHPKIKKLEELILQELNKNSEQKIIVFNHYRDSVTYLESVLNKNPLISAKRFVGQASKGNEKGLNQKEQKEIIDDFKQGKYNVLIASSVHPDEFIIVRNDIENKIEIKKIGDFVDSYIPDKVKENKVIKINGYSTLSYNGKKTIFLPITHVHKHPRKSIVVDTIFSSGFRAQVTEDHSFFTFNNSSELIPSKPKQNLFTKLCFSAPNTQQNTTLDLAKEFYTKLPQKFKNKVFCSISELNQSKMRILSSNKKLLNSINHKSKYISEIANNTNMDKKNIIQIIKRLKECDYLSDTNISIYKTIKISKKGKEYLSYLNWFFNNCKYYKKKYRLSLKCVVESNIKLDKFCNIFINANYGKIKLPRFLNVNPSLAELLGLYVSEGDARNTSVTAGIHLAAQKKEMQRRMASSVINGLGIKPSITWKGVDINSKLAYYLIKYVFCAGIGSYNKEVPSIIFNLPNEHKWKFFEGYTRGDGHITDKRIVLTTVSKKLVTGLIFLLRQLGIKKITLQKNKHRSTFDIYIMESVPFQKINNNGKKCYYDLIPTAYTNNKKYSLFANTYNHYNTNPKIRQKGKVTDQNCFDYIKQITPLKTQPEFVYDLSVEKTQLFAGGQGLICLHNSVAEEGLDIPAVDTIFFYEPVPSDIRTIQRRGRTGRFNTGQIYVLITSNTRDEMFYYSSLKKEKTMKDTLQKLAHKGTLTDKLKKIASVEDNIEIIEKEKPKIIKQKLLNEVIESINLESKESKSILNIKSSSSEAILTQEIEANRNEKKKLNDKITIIVDTRERNSLAAKELKTKDCEIIEKQLGIGDYQVGEDTIIERKSVSDFIASILDGRLFSQAIKLTAFEKALLIVEGNLENIFEERDINKQAIHGAMFSIMLEFKIPILFALDGYETCDLVYQLAKREQLKRDRPISYRVVKKSDSLHVNQRNILEGFPFVGPTLAERLIKEYGSIRLFANTSLERLQKIENVGEKKAKIIFDVLNNVKDEKKD